ncbi:MAG: peptidase M54 [Desulfobacteraceae bacterium]|nr:peptidase M54 [Desulfobacteraceae bacterium]
MDEANIIVVSPIGEIPSWVVKTLSKELEGFFGFKIRVQVLLEDIAFAHDADRNQYYSTKILEKLSDNAPADCLKIIGVTKEDLFIPILTHVYGEAQLGGTSSIISIFRLIEEMELKMAHKGCARIVKEAIHELGHAFDLRHCEDPLCIMHYCRKLADVDLKSDQYCRYCNVLLSDATKDLLR